MCADVSVRADVCVCALIFVCVLMFVCVRADVYSVLCHAPVLAKSL